MESIYGNAAEPPEPVSYTHLDVYKRQDEIQEWHFTPLTWIQQGQEEKVLALAMQHGIEDFYAEKYLDLSLIHI